MRKRRSSAVWLVLPGLWFACERDRPLGNGPDGRGDAGAGSEDGDAGSMSNDAGQGATTSGGGGRAGSAGSTAAAGAPAGIGGSTSAGGFANAGTFSSSGCNAVASPAFDVSHCETPTFSMGDSTCGSEETRAALRCGQPGSQFDATCCRRTQCSDDADCEDAGRCLPRIVHAPHDGAFGSLVEECSPTCDGCSCSGTDDVDHHGYCVNADEGLARFDCPVSGVPCGELSSWRSAVESHRDIADQIGGAGAGAGTVDELQSCLDRIHDELRVRCAGECGDEQNEPFDVSHCETERVPFLGGQSTCSEQETLEVLDCGAPGSQLGRDCCVRQPCTQDADCGDDGRCIVLTLNTPGLGARVGGIEECHLSCDQCKCSGPTIDGPDFAAYCVEADEDIRNFDCPVAAAPCGALEAWLTILPEYRDGLLQENEPGLSAQVQTCIDRTDSELTSRWLEKPVAKPCDDS
jgi:hypothetical protein